MQKGVPGSHARFTEFWCKYSSKESDIVRLQVSEGSRGAITRNTKCYWLFAINEF